MVTTRMLGLALATSLVASLPIGAAAKEDWPSGLFDRPTKVETAKEPATGDDPARQVTCTFYRDLMVRERDTDNPDPDDARLLRPKAGTPAPCRPVPEAGAPTLKTSGMRFLGRHGSLLFFEETETNGVMPFSVLDAATGTLLFEDATTYEGVDSFKEEGGTLRLNFRRGVHAGCSIPQKGAACWARVVREEKLPALVAKLGPPTKACADAYKAAKIAKDDESIISFDVQLAWSGAAPVSVEASGPVYCRPLP